MGTISECEGAPQWLTDHAVVAGVKGRCSFCEEERVAAVCWCGAELCPPCVGLHAAFCAAFPWMLRGPL